MNIEQLRSTIASTHSRMFVVRFTKQDGSTRVMYCKTEIKRFLNKNPNKRSFTKKNMDVICVYDCENNDYRSFKLNSVLEFRCGKVILI